MAALTSLQSLVAAPALRLFGATTAWTSWAACELARRAADGLPVVWVVANDQAAQIAEVDIRAFAGSDVEIEVLTDQAALAFLHSPADRVARLERMSALLRLAMPTGRATCIIATIGALLRKTVAPSELAARALRVMPGQTIDRDQLIATLVSWGWSRSPVVDEPGTFAVRGGIVDVFAPLAAAPIRIELFGDQIESLRSFDAESQRTIRTVDAATLYPCTEYFVTGQGELKNRVRALADDQAFPSKKARTIAQDLQSDSPLIFREPWLPAFHDELVAPLAALAGSHVIVDDPARINQTAHDLWQQAIAHSQAATNAGELRYPVASNLQPPTTWVEAHAKQWIELPALAVVSSHDASAWRAPVAHTLQIERHTELRTRLLQASSSGSHGHPAANEEHGADILIAHVRAWRAQGLRVVLAVDSQSRADRMLGILTGRKLPAVIAPSFDQAQATTRSAADQIAICLQAPAEGFVCVADGLAVLASADIFGEAPKTVVRRKKQHREYFAAVDDFAQLAPGDFVVHQKHGVARYHGLSLIPITGVQGAQPSTVEALHLEYDGGTLYLPAYRLGELDRFIGNAQNPPKLDKLGGVTWQATQTKVARHIQVLAEELLVLYAQRAALSGFAFPPIDDEYRDFAASFPYQETDDQAAAIEDVLRDMEASGPMDRLVCGDVGYGKTEVALRAIFRCIAAGKQAVLLAPTTVLVEQHARTMTERFANFPVNIGKLSRFQSKGEQAAVVKALAEGKVDVVVGTHRLLSPDVRFADLGLVVIDEEQRFGVAHKERLKKMRASVDVLTLTATPIPRTLHLAMAGLRDLSIIATAPTDRLAVRTLVARTEDDLLREAIERELARGGQVFFITRHIDVAKPTLTKGPSDAGHDLSLGQWQTRLQNLLPQARIGVAHGQLAADQLEANMLAFVKGELDILVATTLVESGLDIPRANTMFIARADAFGLAQLYQLRGRIGRSNQRAYCYLLVPDGALTDEATRRLEALQRFAELGAGFSIASQDLEIRGGGELLGAKQSGSIAAVGFDTYIRMLNQAIGELRGQPVHDAADAELNAELPGFLPPDYIPDAGQRLALYKRLSSARDQDALRATIDEIVDRYGTMPFDAVLLCDLMEVKALARPLAALALEVGRNKLVIALGPGPAAKQWHKTALATGWRPTSDGRIMVALPAPGGASVAKRVLAALLTSGCD